MKLWEKETKKENKSKNSIQEKELKQLIERFTVSDDYILDKNLVKHDCIASIAHAEMLYKQKLITKDDLRKLKKGLKKIIQLDKNNQFTIKQQDEDCHTAIENYLTKNYGESGKKIHTARSRNDQVLVALRLYEKEKLKNTINLINKLIKAITSTISKYKNIKFPGYTHMQKAMPTDIKTWLGSYKNSMLDNIKMIKATINLIDQNPLGSAAGFGVPIIDIDREKTTKNLGFSKTMQNPMYCQLSRGKFEAQIISMMSIIMHDLNRIAKDLIIFSMKEFSYIIIPEEFCTGSSIMPQKKNPDLLELTRSRYHIILGEEFKVKSMASNLISGYNKDTQLSKRPLMNSIKITHECLEIMAPLINKIKINRKNCEDALTEEIYATHEAYKLVKQGIPFREAYKKIATKHR